MARQFLGADIVHSAMYDLGISRRTMGSDRQAHLGAYAGLIRRRRRATSDGTIERTMYGIAYVIIPTEFESLQAALDEALAPFRRGGPDEFPREALAFDDVTDELAAASPPADHARGERRRRCPSKQRLASAGDFDFAALAEFLGATGAPLWSGSFADVEPDFDAFARRFTRWKERDARAGGYGRWLNLLGRWDWWELGGRFDGLVSGERRAGAGADSMISSGPNRG